MKLIDEIDSLHSLNEAKENELTPAERRSKARSDKFANAFTSLEGHLRSIPDAMQKLKAAQPKMAQLSSNTDNETFEAVALAILASYFVIASQASAANPVFDRISIKPNYANIHMGADSEDMDSNAKAIMEHMAVAPLDIPSSFNASDVAMSLLEIMLAGDMSQEVADVIIEEVYPGGRSSICDAIQQECVARYNEEVKVDIQTQGLMNHRCVIKDGSPILVVEFTMN